MPCPAPLNAFELEVAEAYLVEHEVDACFDDDYSVAFNSDHSEIFRRVVLAQMLCAVDCANREIEVATSRGLDAIQYLGGLAGINDVREVYAATCHLVTPFVNSLFRRWYRERPEQTLRLIVEHGQQDDDRHPR